MAVMPDFRQSSVFMWECERRPFWPFPDTTVTVFFRSGPNWRCISSTTARPAFSINRRLGIFRSSMAARSRARISAAVTSSMQLLRRPLPQEFLHFADRALQSDEYRSSDDAMTDVVFHDLANTP